MRALRANLLLLLFSLAFCLVGAELALRLLRLLGIKADSRKAGTISSMRIGFSA